MSGSTGRNITLSLSVAGADQVLKALRDLGPAGEAALARLEAAAQRASGTSGGSAGGLNSVATAANNASGGMRNFGQVVGQAGFQVQDFAVQVASGTSALTAFGQQAPQLLGIFGTGGIIAGAAVAVGVLVAKLFEGKSATEQLTEATKQAAEAEKSYADTLRTIIELTETAADRARRLGDARRGAATLGLSDQRNELLGQRSIIERQIAEAEARAFQSQFSLDAQGRLPGRDAGQPVSRAALQGQLEQLDAISRALGELAEQERRLANAGRDLGEQFGPTGEGFIRAESLRRDLDARYRIQKAYDDRLAEIAALRENRDIDAAQATQFTAQAERERADALKRLEDRANGTRRALEAYGETISRGTVGGLDILGAADQRAASEIARNLRGSALDPAVMRREAEQTARLVERENEANARRLDAAVQSYGDSLADTTFRALEEGAQNGKGIFESLASGFGSLLRRAASQGLSNIVFQPIIRAGAEAIGFTGATSGAGSMLGSLGNLTGLSSLLPSGGLISGINSLGVSSGLFGNGVTFAANSGAASYGGFGLAGEGAVSGLFGSGTLSGALGGIGGGFAIGSTLGSFLAGGSQARQTNAMIGSGVGAGIGFLVGGPVGGLIGGTLGGFGGLIGPGPKTNAFGYSLTSSNGIFGLSDLSTTGDGAGGDQAIAAARQQVAQVNAALAAAGLSVNDNNRAITGGGDRPNDGSQSATFEEALGTFRFSSANDNVQTALNSISGGLDAALTAAQFVTGTYEAMLRLREPVSAFDAAVQQINENFGPLIEQSRAYGLATEELEEIQAKQVARLTEDRNAAFQALNDNTTVMFFRAIGKDLEASLLEFDIRAAANLRAAREQLEGMAASAEDTAIQLARLDEAQTLQRAKIVADANAATSTGDGGARSVRGLLESLTFGGAGGLSPEAQSTAARQALDAARRAALAAPTTANIEEYTRLANTTLPVIKGIEGTSSGWAALVAQTADTARVLAPNADIANLGGVIDAVTLSRDAILETGGLTNSLLGDLVSEVRRLAATLTAQQARLNQLAA